MKASFCEVWKEWGVGGGNLGDFEYFEMVR